PQGSTLRPYTTLFRSGGDHRDVEPRARLEVVDDRGPRRIVHRHDQGVADARDRDDLALLGESWIDERSERQVEHDRVEVEVVDRSEEHTSELQSRFDR